MSGKSHVNLTIDESLLQWIDALRGQIPRSTFVNKILSSLSRRSKDIFDWDFEERMAEEDIKRGRLRKFSSAKEAMKWLRK